MQRVKALRLHLEENSSAQVYFIQTFSSSATEFSSPMNCEIKIKQQIAYVSKTHDVSVTEKDLWLDFGYRHVFVLPSHWQKLTED